MANGSIVPTATIRERSSPFRAIMTGKARPPSLNAFLANFCATATTVPPQAANSGIYRETMTQPGVYWMLDAPFVRIIGLYSNRLENPGFLEGDGGQDTSQLDWLEATLKSIAANKSKKALVIATHHPPYQRGGP
jgi:3',5'-cyclic AMP phosphodiesterase CpdA